MLHWLTYHVLVIDTSVLIPINIYKYISTVIHDLSYKWKEVGYWEYVRVC